MPWHDCSPKNPFRVPHWRWRRAVEIVERTGPKFNRFKDDQWTHHAANFCRLYRNSDGSPGRIANLAEAFPAIYWAFDIWNSDTDTHRQLLRWEVEARFLARQNAFQIGERCGLDPLVLEAFEKLFFHVSDRLGNKPYILHQVIGERMHRGLQIRDFEVIWKIFGYSFGPTMLDVLIEQMVSPAWPTQRNDVRGVMEEQSKDNLRRVGMLTTQTLNVSFLNQLEVVDRYLQLLTVEATTGAGGANKTYLDNMRVMLETMASGLRAGPDTGKQVDQAPLAKYDNLSAELRSDEQLALLSGDAGPSLESLREIELPALPHEAEQVIAADRAATE